MVTSNTEIDMEANSETSAPEELIAQPELGSAEMQPQAPAPEMRAEAQQSVELEPVEDMPSPQVETVAQVVEPQPRREGRAERGNGSGRANGGDQGEQGINMKALLESGVHFGHQTKRWNPKMKSYIFTERNGIHIIDLQQTVAGLQAAMSFVSDLVANGGKVLFVGTKKQAQESIREEAERGGQLYVNKRWMGGMLTNFTTIRSRLRYLASLEDRQARGEFADLPKAEARKLEEQIEKLNSLLGGIKEMRDMPDAVFIVDPHRERIAITEAIKLGLTVVAMVDTNCDPDEVDYIIPSNDDAIRAVRVITAKMADAAIEGQQRRESRRADQDADYRIEPGEYSFTPDDEETV